MGDERNVIFIYYCGGHNRRSSGVVIEVNQVSGIGSLVGTSCLRSSWMQMSLSTTKQQIRLIVR